mmetsp:Transcript_28533/g.66294  ORF Transcript_28533/g.66294 Transcript_28533/m.66294 type:complete len:95 (-) Transcript_28533:278-562(-)
MRLLAKPQRPQRTCPLRYIEAEDVLSAILSPPFRQGAVLTTWLLATYSHTGYGTTTFTVGLARRPTRQRNLCCLSEVWDFDKQAELNKGWSFSL